MAWPYHFVDLSEAQKSSRRHLLDRYGSYALLSATIPVLGFQLYLLATWVFRERQRAKPGYSAVPGSPGLKKSQHTSAQRVATKLRQLKWWLETDVADGYGTRGQAIAAVGWTSWLFFLCVAQTGNDYMHVTKRVGTVAASQLPILYMLNMKSYASPMAFAFRASHEELNPYHRMLGRIIYSGLIIHGLLYLNYFLQVGVLLKRLKDTDVILGVTGLVLLTVLMSTAIEQVRRFSYRVFFLCHLSIGITILPVLFFHVRHVRVYVLMSLTLFVLDIVARKLDTIVAFSKITAVPDDNLIKITIPIPLNKLRRFDFAAGQHIYMNLAPESLRSQINRVLYNPFTVAEVRTDSIVLVLRGLNGPVTKDLAHLTKLTKANPPLNIEGPYGSSQRFPEFALAFDRVLLIAGGVGGSFISPLYHQIQETILINELSPRKVKLVWSVRNLKDIDAFLGEDAAKALTVDGRAEIHLTKILDAPNENGDYEMEGISDKRGGVASGRPNLQKIVDDTFRLGENERVAVLVCGPKGMGQEVRSYISPWVHRGRRVWFHDERFGW